MGFVLLRHLRGAKSPPDSIDSPEHYASLFNSYLPDLLRGDFSIREVYEGVCDEFYGKLIKALTLPAEDPIRDKVACCDISWLDDIK